jgi:fermentation-respiration switch protein FrsA (DUF1100 family)
MRKTLIEFCANLGFSTSFGRISEARQMLQTIERLLTYKPNSIEHGGLSHIQHERVTFGSEFGLDLDGAWMPRDSSSTVLFIHGNRHNVTRFKEHYDLFDALGISCFTFDFPGYGRSRGTPSETALYASARAAYSYVIQKLGKQERHVAVYGCSLGGAVALELLSHSPAGCLITESTFTNSLDMANFLYPILPWHRFMPRRFTNDSRIQTISTPKLLIHGTKDPRVPVHMAHTLFQEASDPKELVLIDEADHIDCLIRGGKTLHAKIGDFIARHCQ